MENLYDKQNRMPRQKVCNQIYKLKLRDNAIDGKFAFESNIQKEFS